MNKRNIMLLANVILGFALLLGGCTNGGGLNSNAGKYEILFISNRDGNGGSQTRLTDNESKDGPPT